MAFDPSVNPTTMWRPGGLGFGNYGQEMMDQMVKTPMSQNFMIANPKYNPNDPSNGEPEMIADPTATATPTMYNDPASGTKGVMNPFGLQWGGDMSRYAGIIPNATSPGVAPPAAGQPPTPPPVTPPTPPPTGGETGETKPPDWGAGHAGNRPPDQMGVQGTFDPASGKTIYQTDEGPRRMDQAGNWFDEYDNPINFDQGGGGRDQVAYPSEWFGKDPNPYVPADNKGGDENLSVQDRQLKAIGYTQDASGQYTIPPSTAPVDPNAPGTIKGTAFQPGSEVKASTSDFHLNGKDYRMTPTGLIEVAAGASGGAGNSGGQGNGVGTGATDPYQRGVTSSSIDPKTGKMRYDPTNPYQFATESAAQGLAGRYGGQAFGQNLQGPGMGFSSQQQMIRLPDGRVINAGLAAQAMGRPEYGSGAPGSYGEYSSGLMNTGGKGYDAWARSQPGFRENPRLANTGAVGNQYMQQQPTVFNTVQQPPQQNQQFETMQGRMSPQMEQFYRQYQQPQGGGFGAYQGGNQNNYNFGNYGAGQGGQPRQQQQQYQQQYQYPQNRYGASQYGQYQAGSYGNWGQGGGNTRQGSRQPYQPYGGYTAGKSSGQYNPYKGYGTPQASTSGGYMQQRQQP